MNNFMTLAFATLSLFVGISGVNADRIRVGLFSDADSTDAKSREAAWKILSTTEDFEARRVTGAEVRAGALDTLDVIVFPGGSGSGEAKSLGVQGGKLVTEFVRAGKGAIGICAGGYLFMEGWTDETRAIELINVDSYDDKNWARGEEFVTVHLPVAAGWDRENSKVVINTKFAELTTSHTMWFENGPLFIGGTRNDLLPAQPLLVFKSDVHKPDKEGGAMPGRAAAVAQHFHKGRVVAFSSHPELSPGLGHWLQNAIRWAGARYSIGPIYPTQVLENRLPLEHPDFYIYDPTNGTVSQ